MTVLTSVQSWLKQVFLPSDPTRNTTPLQRSNFAVDPDNNSRFFKREFYPEVTFRDRLRARDNSDPSIQASSIRVGVILNIRWATIAAEIFIIAIFRYVLAFPIDLLPIAITILISFGINFYFGTTRYHSEWLREKEVFRILVLDLLVLALILYFTGGSDNPFILLLLIPSTIGVTILTLRNSVLLTILVILCNSLLTHYHMPLPWPDPVGPAIPTLYIFCTWLSINLAALFISVYSWQIAADARLMNSALNETQLALLREKRISALGALAASAAHELGSPLSTIAVIARELSHEISTDSPIYPDIELLISETIRCRDILTMLSNRPETEVMFEHITASHLIMELGELQKNNYSRQLIVTRHCTDESSEPELPNRPEFLHGLENLIKNAFQFAETKVVVTISWTLTHLVIVIGDDGPGFSPSILSRIGEPYLSSRTGEKGHMGLGIFIATTLLQRSKATIFFANKHYGGAEVRIHWNRKNLESLDEEFS